MSATTATDALSRAAVRFADTWKAGGLVDEIAGALSCVEAAALAGLLRAAGAPEAAEVWEGAHVAPDDECGGHDADTVDGDAVEGATAQECPGCGALPGQPCNPHMGCG